MIKSVTIQNHIKESTTIELSDPSKTGIVIESITGLGPQKATVHVTEFANMDGGIYSSSRLPSRNIVFNLSLIEGPTVEDVRLSLYRIFPIKKKVTLLFDTDTRKYRIEGIVESIEPNIFSEKETVSVSIICADPYFYEDNNNNNKWVYKSEPLFEFPFSNESLTENLIEFSRINETAELTVINPGMDDIGGRFYFYFAGPVKGLTITNMTSNSQFIILDSEMVEIYGGSFEEGDEVEIVTIKGKRSAILYRGGSVFNILNAVDRNSDWIEFLRGENVIVYSSEEHSENVSMELNVEIEYEGI